MGRRRTATGLPCDISGVALLIPLLLVGLVVVLLGRAGATARRRDLPLVWPPAARLVPVTGKQRGLGPWRTAALGFATGLIFGVPARAWMRLISPDPEFTWSGSIAIGVGFGLLFTGAGLCLAGHRRGWSKRALIAAHAVGGVLILPAFGGAGILALPTVVFGGLAVARWDFRVPLRLALATIAVVVAVATMTTIPGDGLAPWRAALGIALYPAVLWPLLLAARLPLLPLRAAEVPA